MGCLLTSWIPTLVRTISPCERGERTLLSSELVSARCCDTLFRQSSGPSMSTNQEPWPNQSAAAIRSGWATTEKTFAACERFARGEPSLRAQTSPLQRRPAGQSDGSGNWTRSRPLARPCGPAAVGSIPFAASQAAQVSAIVAADRAVSVPNATTIWFPKHLAMRSAHRGPAAVAELGR